MKNRLKTSGTPPTGRCADGWQQNRAKECKTASKVAKQALEQFKMEAANEVGVNLQQGYNGDLGKKQQITTTCCFFRFY